MTLAIRFNVQRSKERRCFFERRGGFPDADLLLSAHTPPLLQASAHRETLVRLTSMRGSTREYVPSERGGHALQYHEIEYSVLIKPERKNNKGDHLPGSIEALLARIT